MSNFSLKGLNCIFTGHSSTGQELSPYILVRIGANMQISSVTKIHCNQAFWNDSFSLEDISESNQCIQIEVHNYTLYEKESDLFNESFGDEDFLGVGYIDFAQLSSQPKPIAQSKQQPSHPTLCASESKQSSNSSAIFIGQAAISSKEGNSIGTLQFTIHKESQRSPSNSQAISLQLTPKRLPSEQCYVLIQNRSPIYADQLVKLASTQMRNPSNSTISSSASSTSSIENTSSSDEGHHSQTAFAFPLHQTEEIPMYFDTQPMPSPYLTQSVSGKTALLPPTFSLTEEFPASPQAAMERIPAALLSKSVNYPVMRQIPSLNNTQQSQEGNQFIKTSESVMMSSDLPAVSPLRNIQMKTIINSEPSFNNALNSQIVSQSQCLTSPFSIYSQQQQQQSQQMYKPNTNPNQLQAKQSPQMSFFKNQNSSNSSFTAATAAAQQQSSFVQQNSQNIAMPILQASTASPYLMNHTNVNQPKAAQSQKSIPLQSLQQRFQLPFKGVENPNNVIESSRSMVAPTQTAEPWRFDVTR